MSASVAESQLIGSILHDDHDGDESSHRVAPLPSSRAFLLSSLGGGGHSIHPPIQRSTSAPPQLAEDDNRNLTFIAALKAAAVSSNPTNSTSPRQSTAEADSEQPSVDPAESGNASAGTVVVNGETVAANDPRLSPEYYAYYYLQRPLDPRLPPPLFNWSNWHYANANKLSDPKRNNEQPNASGASEAAESMHSGTVNALQQQLQQPVEQKVDFERKEPPTKVHGQPQNERRDAANSVPESKHSAASQRAAHSSATSFPMQQPPHTRPAAEYPTSSSSADAASFMSSSPSYPPHSHYLTASTAAYLTMSPTSSPLTEPLDSYEPLKQFQSLNLADTIDPNLTAAPSPPFTAVPAFLNGLPGGAASPSASFRAVGNGMGGNNVSPMLAVMGFGALAGQQAATASFQQSSHARPSVAPSSPYLHNNGMSPHHLDRSNPNMFMSRPVDSALKAALSPISLPMSLPQQQLEQYGQLSQLSQLSLNMQLNMNMNLTSMQYGSPQLASQQPQPRRGSGQYWDSPPMAGMQSHARGRDAFNHHNQQRALFDGKATQQRPYNSHHNNTVDQYEDRSSPLAFGLNPALSPSLVSLPPKFLPPTALPPPALPVASAHSAWLDDFRLNKSNSHLTLFDITARGLLLDLSCDQFGSRFIQQRLETASADEKEAALAAVVSDVFRLSEDVFGNYVVQKLLEHGTVEQRRLIGLALSGHAFELSMHMYGCRVVQKCLDVCEPELQAILVRELNGHVMQLVRDSNGNHVIQKCIERCPPHVILFIVNAFSNQVAALSTHPYGCRVVQRLLEHTGDAHRIAILSEIMRAVDELCKNSYGNYVVQHVLIHGQVEHRAAIVRSVKGRLLQLSKHKFASNVVEKCLTGDHMVLTRSGWRSIKLIRVDDVVASLNVTSWAMEWKKVVATQRFALKAGAKQLYRMQGEGMDVVATRDHRMLTAQIAGSRLQKRNPLAYYSVDALLGFTDADSSVRAVPRSGVNRQPAWKLVIPQLQAVCDWWWEKDQQRGFLRFFGFWLGNGHLDVTHQHVGVSQRKLASTAWLIDLLDDMFPGCWRRSVVGNDATGATFTYVIRCPPLYEWLRPMAAGPVGYNPRDPTALRSYPHFTPNADLAAHESQTLYRLTGTVVPDSYSWTEPRMLAAFAKGPPRCRQVNSITRAHPDCDGEEMDQEQCWWCAGTVGRTSNELVMCGSEGCAIGGHLICAGLTAKPEGDWFCTECSNGSSSSEGGTSCSEAMQTGSNADRHVISTTDEGVEGQVAGELAPVEEEEEEAQVDVDALPDVFEDAAAAGAAQAVGTIVWNGELWSINMNSHWFCHKRWMGEDVASTFANLSQPQATALLEGFCRAEGDHDAVQFDAASGAPVGDWRCSNSSFPLIDHVQLIAQLAEARVDLVRIPQDGQTSVAHWQLGISFTLQSGAPVPLCQLAQPLDVSNDVDARGYYNYQDDGHVYDLTIDSHGDTNSNFLTQRLSIKRHVDGGEEVRAEPVFVGNCFAHASKQDRDALIDEVLGKSEAAAAPVVESNSVLIGMVKDQFGNYVIQRLIDVLDDEQLANMVQRIRRYVPSLRKIPYGRHILAKIEKITGQQL